MRCGRSPLRREARQQRRSSPAPNPVGALRASTDPVVVAWREQFHEFLHEYGWRTEGMCDPTLAPWVEDPTPAITMLTTFLRKDDDHDFDAAQRDAIAERDETLARVRAGLSGEALERFEGGLGALLPRELRVVARGAQRLHRHARAHPAAHGRAAGRRDRRASTGVTT